MGLDERGRPCAVFLLATGAYHKRSFAHCERRRPAYERGGRSLSPHYPGDRSRPRTEPQVRAGPFISPLPPGGVRPTMFRPEPDCIEKPFRVFALGWPTGIELERLLKAERLAVERYDRLRGYPGGVQEVALTLWTEAAEAVREYRSKHP
jgi:hypothetical protein